MQTEKNEVLPENNDEAGKIGLESAISNEAGEGVATSEPAAGTAPAAGTEPEIKIDTSEIAAGIDKKKPTRARKPKTPKGEEQKPDEAPKPEAPEKKTF